VPSPQPAPHRWRDILRCIGPGLIVTASIVGSGELIVTPALGSRVGFMLLWFIILGCLVKVFVQMELGRFAIARGMTTLQAMDSVPGPRLVVSWLVWVWLVMFCGLLFQIAGMLGGLAQIAAGAGLAGPPAMWAAAGAILTSVLLVAGRYRMVENACVFMVVLFTVCTVIAVGALQWTPWKITAANLATGLKFQIPDTFTVAFAAFAIIGVGASELIYYPYWCLEKGYAKFIGPHDGTPARTERALGWIRVMKADAWFSFIVYTLATVAFYLLGAAVLHAKGLKVENKDMIATLSHMYRETLGTWGFTIFLIGALNVLYSTVFAATASNARLLVDGITTFRLARFAAPGSREKAVKVACAALPLFSLAIFLLWGEPVTLVIVGALGQGLMLPFLGMAAVYFRRQTDPAIRSGPASGLFLWIAAASMAAVGIYQFADQLSKWLAPG
jgi:Mn2+/Fe2+ NRAMP family transporter